MAGGILDPRIRRGGIRMLREPTEVTLPELSVTAAPAPATGGPGGGMMRKPLGEYFRELEQSRGLPADYLAKTRAIESSNGRNTVNPMSSARGDFQFIRSTAKRFGVNTADPYDSARGAADLAAENAKAFQAKFGRAPTGPDLYGMHQQGSGGYFKLLSGQRTGDAEMRLNGGANLSGTQMVAKIHGMYDKARPGNLEGFTPSAVPSTGANVGQGPTVEAAAAGALQAKPQGPPMPNAAQAAQMAQDNTYKGGLLGLLGGGDPNAAGMGKDVLGKLGDLAGGGAAGGGAIGTALKGLAEIIGGGQEQRQPDRPIVVNPDNVNTPNTAMLQLLKRRRIGGAV